MADEQKPDDCTCPYGGGGRSGSMRRVGTDPECPIHGNQ